MAQSGYGPVVVNVNGIAYRAFRHASDGGVITIQRYAEGGGDPHPHAFATAKWIDDRAVDPDPRDTLPEDMPLLLDKITEALRAHGKTDRG